MVDGLSHGELLTLLVEDCAKVIGAVARTHQHGLSEAHESELVHSIGDLIGVLEALPVDEKWKRTIARRCRERIPNALLQRSTEAVAKRAASNGLDESAASRVAADPE